METLNKIKSVKLCLMAHPDNEQDSEFSDRILDLEEIKTNFSEMFEMLKELKDWIFNEQGYCTKYFEIEQLLTKINEK